MILYSYWRSTTSYRVRAALNLKKIDYEIVPVELEAGEQTSPEYVKINPGKGVPTLVLDDGTVLCQSMAILEFIDASWPEPGLAPKDPVERAKMMAIAHTVALDIHPVNNLRVVNQLKDTFEATPEQCQDWMKGWMRRGFEAVEALLPQGSGFVFGGAPGIADLCIVAQAYNAHRWGLDLEPFPGLKRIEKLCLEVPAIAAAHPDNQPDAEAP